jgi:hypothetical protein
LTAVTIPSSVVTISDCAFFNNQLTTITIPNSVATIGGFAFYKNLLTTATIPSSVTTIGGGAFGANEELSSVLLLGAAPTITAADATGPSFGEAAGKTIYYLPAYAADFGKTWNGYTTGSAISFTSTSIPTIVGVVKVGQTLTAHVGIWSPAPTLSYVWTQVGSATVLGLSATYTPTVTDVDETLIVSVTGYAGTNVTSTATSAATVAVAAGTFTTAPTPLIYGTVQLGKTLIVDAGDWPDDTTLTYAWKWSGTATTVGIASLYAPTATDVGKKLTMTVTASLPGYTDAVVTSAQTTTIVAKTFALAPTPTVLGTKTIGEPLTALTGTWTSGAALSYAWKRSDSTTAVISTDARYTLVAADVGKTLTVTVTATRTGFTTLSKTSANTAVILGLAFTTTPTPTITGTKTSGSTLTAVTGTWAPSADVTFTYVWKRATTSAGTKTTISGATSKTYKLVTADKSKYITVTVTAKKTGYTSTAKTSADGGTKIAS